MPDGLRRWMFNLSGFNQYGLYKNDVMLETPEVEEAIRRLPSHLQDERAFRIQRAVQCSVMKTVLPKDQWPTWDEDMEKGRYLEPLLEEVQREKAEQSEWAKR
jgi:ubiquinol-cytochrome c reductase subunit 7